jgi:hypothetical protein
LNKTFENGNFLETIDLLIMQFERKSSRRSKARVPALWGQERLENLLRACRDCGPAQIVSRILDDVLPFAKDCAQKDDMTLLVVLVKDG